MTQISICTVQRKYGDFCEWPSAPDVPFPICARHAAKLLAHLDDIPRDELADFLAARTRTTSGPRTHGERVDQSAALRGLCAGRSTVYAVQFPDGVIKIGCTNSLADRYRAYVGNGGQIVGFKFGGFADELAIHRSLATHVVRGREWYHPTPEVLAVVNDMRADFGLEPIAA